jgi:hypothetical protein
MTYCQADRSARNCANVSCSCHGGVPGCHPGDGWTCSGKTLDAFPRAAAILKSTMQSKTSCLVSAGNGGFYGF